MADKAGVTLKYGQPTWCYNLDVVTRAMPAKLSVLSFCAIIFVGPFSYCDPEEQCL